MMDIFYDMVEYFVEVVMDDFFIFGYSFEVCLYNLLKVLARYEEVNLELNWVNCNFLVKEDIILSALD